MKLNIQLQMCKEIDKKLFLMHKDKEEQQLSERNNSEVTNDYLIIF